MDESLLEWVKRGKRRNDIILTLNKPMISAEIRRSIGLSKINNISIVLKELINKGIVRNLTPLSRIGKIYGLTPRKGKELRKELLGPEAIYFEPTCSQIDWHTYGKVVCGAQRRAIIKVLDSEPMRVREILERARKIHPAISEKNPYDVLRKFTKEGIVERIAKFSKKKKKPLVWYRLSEKGRAIAEQISGPIPSTNT
jgi:DNA-binding HxlR family transcriptional regulator